MATKPHNLAAINGATAKPALPTINPATWEGLPLPPREWLVDQWIPLTGPTYFTGAGSVGKSLIAQQLMTASAVGKSFLGQSVKRVRCAYITAEDDIDELHRRQDAINKALGVEWRDLDGWLQLASLTGRSAALASIGAETTILPLFDEIAALVEKTGIQAMALDNVAHLLMGNENDRSVVTAFVGICNRLSIMMNGPVLLIGHPNKAGDEFSGSTAWTNVVRARLYMSHASERDGYVDPDSRVLTRPKFNYGPKGEKLTFRWHKGAFVCEDEIPSDYLADMSRAAAAVQENDRFMECLDACFVQGRNVSHAVGGNYAPKIFAGMTEAKGMPKEAFERAMERLLHLGEIKAGKPVHKYPNRTVNYGLVRKGHAI